MKTIDNVIRKARAVADAADMRSLIQGVYMPADRELINALIAGLRELAEDLENHKTWRSAELATGNRPHKSIKDMLNDFRRTEKQWIVRSKRG